MLARWFDRSGIGQVLAPDEKIAKEPIAPEAAAPFWQIVAPDPVYLEKVQQPVVKAPPLSAFLPHDNNENSVQCRHCQQWTPAAGSPPSVQAPTTPTKGSGGNNEGDIDIRTPTPKSLQRKKSFSEVDELVLSAAKEYTFSIASPPDAKDGRDKMFRICGSSKPLNESLQNRLRKQFKKHPKLLTARASGLGQQAPDGYTPLMAAAYANNVAAASIILELASTEDALNRRDLQGRAALHIASEMGSLDMVNFLKGNYPVGSPPPVDLLGRTPLGRAVTSPHPAARKHQKELENVLFSPGDVSVYGTPMPGFERTGIANTLQVAYGTADMPGMRVEMEDAVVTSMWQRERKPYCLLGVCDGHGDKGQVSKYIADYAPAVLQSNMLQGQEDWTTIWTQTCLTLDSRIKEKELAGGSTGVLALITVDSVIVANVGDSRCILIQTKRSDIDNLGENLGKMTVSDGPESSDDKGYPRSIDEDLSQHATPSDGEPLSDGPIVQALSEDHKPNSEQEQARIEKAGLKVIAETFEENGEECTIHKVERSKKDKLAVSRAFGDFEYKQNATLGPDEQAVVAVPDVHIYSRDPEIDSYLVLACDGVWDVMSNEEVAEFVVRQMEVRSGMTDTALPEVGDALANECIRIGSRDNISVIIAALSQTMEKLSVRSSALEGKTLDFASPRKR